MPESFTPAYEKKESGRFERLHIAHEKATEYINEELERRHANKPYHNPEHTNGTPEGVVTGVSALTQLLKDHMTNSIDRVGQEQFAQVAKGMEAGAQAHDVVIEINGIDPKTRQVMRQRGWVEGGNERESFLFYRQKFIELYIESPTALSKEEAEATHFELLVEDSAYGQYITSVEQAIAGTDPDAISFPEVPEAIQAELDPTINECLKNPLGTPSYLRLDSTKTQLSLEALLTSTADLLAAAYPDKFFKTGNGEFWELNVGISEDCVEFLSHPESFTRERAKTILGAMQGWRKVQIGVALGQKIRLRENFTDENISELFQKSFNTRPDPHEVTAFTSAVHGYEAGIDDSIKESYDRFNHFRNHFNIVEPEETERTPENKLTPEEIALLQEAIVYMGGQEFNLAAYVAEVKAQTT